MKLWMFAVLLCWIICSLADGRKALLPEFSFKKPSKTNTAGEQISFTDTALLNEARRSPIKTGNRGGPIKTGSRDAPINTGNRGGRDSTDVFEPRKIFTVSHWAPKQRTNQQPKRKDHGQSMQEARSILLHGSDNSRKGPEIHVVRHISSPKGKWENEVKFDRQPEREVLAISDRSQKSPTRPAQFLEDSMWPTSPYSEVSVTMVTEKSIGSPRPHKDIPYCSWIDISDCLDVSKLKSECIESPTIPALEGECKMCPFNWCKESSSMIESGKLHQKSPLDGVINEGANVQSPKFGHAINQPFSGHGQNNWHLKSVDEPNSKTTTEIPFWNFQTFGP